MRNNRLVGVPFTLETTAYMTMVDSRTRNKFRKLISNWVVDGSVINLPKSGETFTYMDVNVILDRVENTYKDLEKIPEVGKIAERVFNVINAIRMHNNAEAFALADGPDSEEDED